MFHKGLVFTPLALALAVPTAVPTAVRCNQASICPAVKAGPAFQVPSAFRVRKGRKGDS